jgi:vacuolar-type H+-ATPase subunit I/STV1
MPYISKGNKMEDLNIIKWENYILHQKAEMKRVSEEIKDATVDLRNELAQYRSNAKVGEKKRELILAMIHDKLQDEEKISMSPTLDDFDIETMHIDISLAEREIAEQKVEEEKAKIDNISKKLKQYA